MTVTTHPNNDYEISVVTIAVDQNHDIQPSNTYEIEITPKELKKKNPIEYDQLVFFGIIPKEVDQNLKEGKTFKNFMSSINN